MKTETQTAVKQPLTLTEMQKRCYQQANESGWTDKPIAAPEMIALLHSEASEALECYRSNEPLSWERRDPNNAVKPEGLASEFVDILIRLGHDAKSLGIDLEREVLRKLALQPYARLSARRESLLRMRHDNLLCPFEKSHAADNCERVEDAFGQDAFQTLLDRTYNARQLGAKLRASRDTAASRRANEHIRGAHEPS